MLNVIALLLLPSNAVAAGAALGTTPRRAMPTLSVATKSSDHARTWYVGAENAPADEVYSYADVFGHGGSETDAMQAPLTTGSATASSSVSDQGESEDVSWLKAAEASHTSSWRLRDRNRYGISWTYTGSGSHAVDAALTAPECVIEEGDLPDLGCMLQVSSIGMSGIQSTADSTPGAGNTGGFGGSSGAGGDADDDIDDTTFLVVDETTDFQLVAGFHAAVAVDVEGHGLGEHGSAFSVIVRNRATGLVALDWAAQPLAFSWSFSAEESGSLRESDSARFTLEPGEYELQMDVSDATSSYTWADPETTESNVTVDSSVRAVVLLSSY